MAGSDTADRRGLESVVCEWGLPAMRQSFSKPKAGIITTFTPMRIGMLAPVFISV
jgi:hypothetical protein